MYRRVIQCQITNEYVKGAGVPVGAAGSHHDVALELSFSPMWEGSTRTIIWYDALMQNPTLTMLTPNLLKEGETEVYIVPIPAEPKAEPGEMTMTIKGVFVEDGIETSATLSTSCKFTVLPSDYDEDAEEAQDVNPTLAEQLQAEIEKVKEDIVDARAAATEAAASASSAAVSAQGASGSRQAAAASQIAAAESEANALASKNAAVNAAGSAAGSAAAAETSKEAAEDAETNAEGSARSASESVGIATAKAGEAAASAAAAKASADAAEGFKSNAASNATAAAGSAAEAKTSETNAKDSETAAEKARDEAQNAATTLSTASIDANGHLVLTAPDGSTRDLGPVVGSSIQSIDRTAGNGAPGTTDTYTVTLTDGSTTKFYVYNGKDGTGAGDMTTSVYDPQGKGRDVFAYADAAVADRPTNAEMNAAIAAIPKPDVSGQIETHNASTTAHSDIRAELATKAPAYTYGTEDLEAGVTPLAVGTLYFVYE